MKVHCCVCHAVRDEGAWHKARPKDRMDQDVSHGYCPKCAAKAFSDIRALRRSRPSGLRLAANQ